MEMAEYIVNGIPLITVILGLVELTKKFGASGKLLTAISFVIGVVLGILYQFSVKIPVSPTDWFGAIIFGLALGLTACQLYDAVRSASTTR
jgi:hypothetical protein